MIAWLEEGVHREGALLSVLKEDRMLSVAAMVSVCQGMECRDGALELVSVSLGGTVCWGTGIGKCLARRQSAGIRRGHALVSIFLGMECDGGQVLVSVWLGYRVPRWGGGGDASVSVYLAEESQDGGVALVCVCLGDGVPRWGSGIVDCF